MSDRVVWYEGMSLDPHHLQVWGRHHAGVVNGRIRSLSRFGFGLTRLEIDRDRLVNGEFSVMALEGVLPDGLLVDVPEKDAAPGVRSIQGFFGSTADRLGVYLAVPAERASGANVLLQDAPRRRETRYRAETIVVVDENTGADEREIEVARLNLEIRFDGEPTEAYAVLRIAEVTRSASGTFVLHDHFVPTCLSMAASDVLMNMTRRLLELMVAKSASLSDRARSVLAQRELSPTDVSVLGLQGAVNAYIPQIHHHLVAHSHPEALYLTLVSFAGQLSVWVPGGSLHPREYPVFDHAAPSECFTRMDALLREMLGVAKPPSNYLTIPLQRQRENLYVAELEAGLVRDAQFFLVARSDQLPEERLVAELPQKLRVASPQTINAVLQSVIRALPIEHTSRLPSGLPVDRQANYFQLQKRGPFWEAIRDSGGIAVFVPSEFNGLDLRLVAVPNP
jgi:type VI secretion system protein ImpJ